MPSYLYHGSRRAGLKKLKPYPSRVIGNKKAVFATPQRWAAVAFMGTWKDSDIVMGTVNGKPYLTEQYAGAFNKAYAGGHWLYQVSPEGFRKDSRLMSSERISESSVTVLKSEFISDPLKELMRLKVNLTYYGDSKKQSMKIARNMTSQTSKTIWRGKMSTLVPKLQKKFALRAPAVLKAFSVKVPEALDPQLRVVVSAFSETPQGELDQDTGVIFLNISPYTAGENFKGKPALIRKAVHEMDHVLWHEYVHYLQFTSKLVAPATKFDAWFGAFKILFIGKRKLYFTNSIEQQAFIEEFRYMREQGKSEQDIKIAALRMLLKTIKSQLKIPEADLEILARTLLNKDRKKFIRVMFYHYKAVGGKTSSLYARFLVIKMFNDMYKDASITLTAFESFFKMMDYQSKNPKVRWFRPLV